MNTLTTLDFVHRISRHLRSDQGFCHGLRRGAGVRDLAARHVWQPAECVLGRRNRSGSRFGRNDLYLLLVLGLILRGFDLQ